MTLEGFILKYDGTPVDFDGAYGSQCFTKDHYVLMSDWTYKPIQDIKIGDKVIGFDNKINTVTSLFKNEKEVIHIQTGLNDLWVTPDHPFYCLNGKFIEAEKLIGNIPAIFDHENYEESGLTDNELLFLGFWLGDGNIGKHKDNRTDEIRITYGEKKRDFVLSLAITGNERLHHESNKAYVSGLLKFNHKKLTDIILNSCSGEYKKLPLIFSNREYELILKGFIKADGSAKRKAFVLTNTSLSLLMSIQAIAILLGYDTESIRLVKRCSDKIFIRGKEVKSIKPIYRLTLNKNSSRKNKIKILEKKTEIVYNIETDGTHTYICNNYKVHNCVDIFRQYCHDVLGIPHTGPCSTTGGAMDLYNDYDKMPLEKKYFTKIKNLKIIKPGDVVIWNKTATNKYGHVAVCIGSLNSSLIVFEQNGIKQDGAKIQLRSKENLLGILRFKKV